MKKNQVQVFQHELETEGIHMSLSSNIRAGRAYVEVTAETSKLQRNLTSAQAQLQNFGRTCTNVGKDLLMLSGAMAAPLVMAARSFAGFDDSMRLVQAVTQATDADFKALTKTAQRLGRDTSYTAQQAADAMVSLGRMGFSPTEIQASIDAVLNLARSTGTELAEAGDIAANSMRIFGIEASQMSDVADVLTVTANSSAQTLIDLFEALKMGGPQAAAAGESIRETSAAIAVLANMGIKGSLAGTALRKSFSQFAKVKVQDQLRSVGVETVDANGNLRKMAEIMRDIAKAMSTMPTAEKLAFAEDIFDIRGSLAGLTLTANTDELDAMLAKLQDVEGVAADTAKKMDAGLGGAFRLLLSAVEGAMNAIADAMNSTLQPLIVKVTAVINAFTQWIEANRGLVTAFAVTVAGAAGLAVGLIAIGVAAKGAAAGIAVVQTAIKGFTFLQGVAIAQGTALKTSFTLLTQSFSDYRNTAIPAMVGTEKFCAALGLASTSANRARASIILMSNAEAAAAAKSALAAKWRVMTNALKNFSLAAVAATAATKAQAAAEAAAAVKTALVSGWTAMANALKGLTLSSIAAAAALKAQAVAEGAMAAGRTLATAWTTMASALKSYTAASIAATVAVKAQTVAEALCTAGTVALNQVRKAGIAVTALFTAANLKAVVAVSAVAVGNFLLAAAAKVAAAAMVALGAVMSFIAAHPVAVALIALGAVLAGVCIYLSRAGTYTAQLSDKMSTLREKGDQLRKTDEIRMERLQQLAAKQKLTNAEMAEARMLASKLQKKYGDLGITISDNAMRITALGAAASRIGAMELSVKDSGDLDKLRKLKALSLEVTLDVDQQNDAERLIGELSKKYGDLGVAVDRTAGKIVRLNSVAANLRELSLKVSGTEDAEKVSRLQELSKMPKLDASGIAEANTLLEQLRAKYGDLGLSVDTVRGRIVALTEAQRQFTAAAQIIQAGNDPQKETHLAQLERLMQLAEQEKLTAAEQQEAQTIVNTLNGAYSDLGLGIDTITGKLNLAASAQDKFNEAMKAATLGELDAEIAELEANLKELQAENEALLSYWNNNLWSQISGRQEEAQKKLEANGDRAMGYRQKIQALQKRRQAVQEGKPGATTGEEGDGTSTEEKVEAEKQRRQAASDNADAAAKRVAEIDRQLARERKSELENEIDDIIALRDEYKQLIQTMLDYEKSRPEKEQDKAKIAELEGKLAGADQTAEDRIAKAREKAARKMKDDVAFYQERFQESEQSIQDRRTEAAQDRKIDETLKNDPAAGQQMLEGLIAQYQKEAAAAKAQFEKELRDAQADGKINDDERKKLDDAHSAYTRAESMVDKYSDRLRSAQDGTREAAERASKPQGAFLAAALENLGESSAADRTAKATEAIADNTKKANTLLKKSSGIGSFK
ncbi:MAG: phage tail tape measure protein [Lentisphaeria bacterium]|nr:phage tail tape measure protein [Lentisphaeria bacterium]